MTKVTTEPLVTRVKISSKDRHIKVFFQFYKADGWPTQDMYLRHICPKPRTHFETGFAYTLKHDKELGTFEQPGINVFTIWSKSGRKRSKSLSKVEVEFPLELVENSHRIISRKKEQFIPTEVCFDDKGRIVDVKMDPFNLVDFEDVPPTRTKRRGKIQEVIKETMEDVGFETSLDAIEYLENELQRFQDALDISGATATVDDDGILRVSIMEEREL